MTYKVQCIDNKKLIQINESLLTIGKWYELVKVETEIEEIGRVYWVIDDTGQLRFYNADRFRPTFEELRDMKIDKILS